MIDRRFIENENCYQEKYKHRKLSHILSNCGFFHTKGTTLINFIDNRQISYARVI